MTPRGLALSAPEPIPAEGRPLSRLSCVPLESEPLPRLPSIARPEQDPHAGRARSRRRGVRPPLSAARHCGSASSRRECAPRREHESQKTRQRSEHPRSVEPYPLRSDEPGRSAKYAGRSPPAPRKRRSAQAFHNASWCPFWRSGTSNARASPPECDNIASVAPPSVQSPQTRRSPAALLRVDRR